MNYPISDQAARELALDPTQSFIVQAPAGSGKTTLLVARYLKLLATVKAPEEILAITFTRKAAHQMQERILAALTKSNEPKYQYILQNPQRLRIKTFDAFCNYLVNCATIVTKIGVNKKIAQNQETKLCYQEAARAILTDLVATEYYKYIATLLLHLDNDWQLVENLLITMLASREQWLPHLVGLKNKQDLRANLEAAISLVYQENLEICDSLLPVELKQELFELLEFSNHCWQDLPELLLTKDYSWRKKITKDQGFPAPSDSNNAEEKVLYKTMKQRMEAVLTKLIQHEEFRVSLENLANSPRCGYSEQQWQIIEALLVLLPLLAAQLKVIFNENNITDYSEVSMAALSALGQEDEPSQLALQLDYQLQHLLIDEFQDTSVAQYRLIEKLIAAWQPDDGHTLFVVGDPMQSIYRFREAEVGLFLRTQTQGIGSLSLQPLYLTMNFRAMPNIVSWINTNFSKIFPQCADLNFGAVPFKPSMALDCNSDNSQVSITLLEDADPDFTLEAAKVIEIIKALRLSDDKATIAILVRARSHLSQIIQSLQERSLAYQAHELTSLEEQTVIKDLFILTAALFNLADRIAWLALLRAPWCSLSLADLHKIATANTGLIWDNIKAYQALNLSTHGQVAMTKLIDALTELINKWGRIGWRNLVEAAWLKLSGPAFVGDAKALEYAQIYLQLLEDNQHNIVKFNNLDIIHNQLAELYPTCDASSQTSKIHLMTIHKAKGLEFDHVIIPGIDRPVRSDSRKLLLWFEKPHLHGSGSSLLLSAIEARGSTTDAIYQYLHLVGQKKAYYETGRLLYVALTRAKKTAHLLGNLAKTSYASFGHLLKYARNNQHDK